MMKAVAAQFLLVATFTDTFGRQVLKHQSDVIVFRASCYTDAAIPCWLKKVANIFASRFQRWHRSFLRTRHGLALGFRVVDVEPGLVAVPECSRFLISEFFEEVVEKKT